jgi:AbrB family looped-hinge helix DNA binding protein
MKRVKVPRRRGYTQLSPEHQVTIPAQVVEQLGLEPGDKLEVDVDRAGRIIVTRSIDGDARRRAILASAGALPGVYEPGEFDRLRDEWR